MIKRLTLMEAYQHLRYMLRKCLQLPYFLYQVKAKYNYLHKLRQIYTSQNNES